MANADEAVGNDVAEEAADELVGVEGQDLHAIAVGRSPSSGSGRPGGLRIILPGRHTQSTVSVSIRPRSLEPIDCQRPAHGSPLALWMGVPSGGNHVRKTRQLESARLAADPSTISPRRGQELSGLVVGLFEDRERSPSFCLLLRPTQVAPVLLLTGNERRGS